MSQPNAIHYIYAIQYMRSHPELIEVDTETVDRALAGLLKQLQAGQEINDQFRQILKTNPKARNWWVNFNQERFSEASVTKGLSGSSAADSGLYGDSALELLSIKCAKCGFLNSLVSWDDYIPCRNSNVPSHYIEL